MLPLSTTVLVFVGAVFCSQCDAQEVITRPPGDEFTRAAGSAMVMTCQTVDVAPGTSVELVWKDPTGRTIRQQTGNRIYVEQEQYDRDDELIVVQKLYITEVQDSDAGLYTCQMMINNVMRSDKAVRLLLYKDITFDYAPSPQYVTIHTDATIHCRVSGTPAPEVRWRFNGRRIEPSDRYSIDDSGLTVKNITGDDGGVYTCRAVVEADGRFDQRRITVVVQDMKLFR